MTTKIKRRATQKFKRTKLPVTFHNTYIRIAVFILIFAALGSYLLIRSFASTPYGFVTQNGTSLYLNGSKFRFAGYNGFYFTSSSINPCRQALTNAQLGAMLDEIKSASRGSVIRTWFFQSFGNPTNWSAFDRVIALAKQRGMYIIPTLENQWGDCEPSSPNSYKTLSWYQGGYKLTNDGYPMSYYNFVQAVAKRYANEPTIMSWQLVNEPSALPSKGGSCNEAAAASALQSFANSVAGAIRSVDPNHLSGLGSFGHGEC